jgi:hypothetical protein
VRLFRDSPVEEADVRPTLLGVVTLLFLLLFFLLSTSSGQRLGVIDLRLAAPGHAPPLPHSGLVKSVRLAVEETAVAIEFEVATTDISASASTRELRRIDIAARDGRLDGVALVEALTTIHDIDPGQLEAEVHPADTLTTATLLDVLDAVRGPTAAPRFPRVSLR